MSVLIRVRWAEPDPADEAGAWLDVVERQRLGHLPRPDDRARFVTSRALLKDLVGSLADVPASSVRLGYLCSHCGADHGKPAVSEPAAATGWQVSLAHAGDRVLVAAARDRPVGVDVEPVGAVDFDGFDRVALTPEEARVIEALPESARPRARASAWVRKEARLKADGTGLRVDPRAVGSDPTGPGVVVRDLAVGPGYLAAVAVLTTASVEVDCVRLSRGQSGGPAAPATRATGAAAR